MSEQSLKNHNATETGRMQRAIAREEYGFLVAAKRGDSAAFEIALQTVRKHGLPYRAANDAEQRGCRRCSAGIVSAGLYSSQELQRRFPVFNVAVPHCHQRFPDETAQKQRLWDVSLDESAETEEPSSRLDVEDQGPNPEQLYAHKERQRILFEAMDGLTPGMRKAIELRELGERSTEETAQIMGISVNAVKARVFHGRKKLRERLSITSDQLGRPKGTLHE